MSIHAYQPRKGFAKRNEKRERKNCKEQLTIDLKFIDAYEICSPRRKTHSHAYSTKRTSHSPHRYKHTHDVIILDIRSRVAYVLFISMFGLGIVSLFLRHSKQEKFAHTQTRFFSLVLRKSVCTNAQKLMYNDGY